MDKYSLFIDEKKSRNKQVKGEAMGHTVSHSQREEDIMMLPLLPRWCPKHVATANEFVHFYK